MKIQPVVFVWREVRIVDDGGNTSLCKVMVPLRRYDNVCGRQFVLNEEYPLVPVSVRSMKSHNQYFAALHDGFESLPETEKRFPTVEHFRHWALVQEGFSIEKNYVCETPAHARRLAALVRSLHEFAVITVQGKTVRIFEAKSQSMAAMNKEEFEASKHAVLDRLESMIGVSRGTLNKEAGRAA